jgi:hypothetical protein
MDQLHLPPDLYREVRDRSNLRVSALLCALAELGRGRRGRSQASIDPEDISQANAGHSHETPRQIGQKGET